MLKNLDNLAVGSTIQILIREKLYNAEVINKPFVKKNVIKENSLDERKYVMY